MFYMKKKKGTIKQTNYKDKLTTFLSPEKMKFNSNYKQVKSQRFQSKILAKSTVSNLLNNSESSTHVNSRYRHPGIVIRGT